MTRAVIFTFSSIARVSIAVYRVSLPGIDPGGCHAPLLFSSFSLFSFSRGRSLPLNPRDRFLHLLSEQTAALLCSQLPVSLTRFVPPPPPPPFFFLSSPPNQPNLTHPSSRLIVLTFSSLSTLSLLTSTLSSSRFARRRDISPRPLSIASNLRSPPVSISTCASRYPLQTHLPVRSASGPVFTLNRNLHQTTTHFDPLPTPVATSSVTQISRLGTSLGVDPWSFIVRFQPKRSHNTRQKTTEKETLPPSLTAKITGTSFSSRKRVATLDLAKSHLFDCVCCEKPPLWPLT